MRHQFCLVLRDRFDRDALDLLPVHLGFDRWEIEDGGNRWLRGRFDLRFNGRGVASVIKRIEDKKFY